MSKNENSTRAPIGLKRSAAMVVLRHEQQFLLLKRSKPPFVGKYVPVGGKLEPFESPDQAAIRETWEEANMKITPDQLHFGGSLIETSPIDYNWQCNIYWASIDYGTPPDCDEGELEWIPFDQLETLDTPPTDWEIYQYLLRGQPFAFNAIYDENMQLISMVEEIGGKKVI